MSRPQLSHFTGQEVTEVNPETEYGPQIVFISGASVYNFDLPDIPEEESLVGRVLVLVSMSEQVTMMHFQEFENNAPVPNSEIVVTIDPATYLIETEDYEPFNPQATYPEEAQATLPPDPSAERTNEEPPGGPESGSKPLPVDDEGQIDLDLLGSTEGQTEPPEPAED